MPDHFTILNAFSQGGYFLKVGPHGLSSLGDKLILARIYDLHVPADDQNATRAGGNNPRARCAIYSRDTAIRICSVPPLTAKNHFIKISAWEEVMSRAKYFS